MSFKCPCIDICTPIPVGKALVDGMILFIVLVEIHGDARAELLDFHIYVFCMDLVLTKDHHHWHISRVSDRNSAALSR